jgi:signal transduction histidine kinase
MPVMSGLEVLDALRPLRRLYSVILVTTLSNLESRVEGLNRGADDYICKPFEADELIARVNAAVRTAVLKSELATARDAADTALARMRTMQDELIEKERVVTLGALAAGLAHRINNPLGFIQSNMQTLGRFAGVLLECIDLLAGVDEAVFAGKPQAAEALQAVRGKKVQLIRNDLGPLIAETKEGVKRITTIVRCLLKLDEASTAAGTEPLDLNRLILTLSGCSGSAVPVTTEPWPAPVMVLGNVGQLSIVLQNLVDNAADAVRDGGTITLKSYRQDCWACVDVKDTGGGIRPDDMPRLFEPFFSSSPDPQKIGLGLTIAQYLVKAHRGSIGLMSDSGGTTATVRLPYYDAQEDAENAQKD